MNSLIKDPAPGAPVPPILPPQEGYLFLDRAIYVSRPAPVVALIEQAARALGTASR